MASTSRTTPSCLRAVDRRHRDGHEVWPQQHPRSPPPTQAREGTPLRVRVSVQSSQKEHARRSLAINPLADGPSLGSTCAERLEKRQSDLSHSVSLATDRHTEGRQTQTQTDAERTRHRQGKPTHADTCTYMFSGPISSASHRLRLAHGTEQPWRARQATRRRSRSR